MGDEVLSPLELSPANSAREHLHSLPGVRRLHVPHHVPFGREQAAAVIAFELASALVVGTTTACSGLLGLTDAAGERCLQDLGQPAICLPRDLESVISGWWVRGNRHGEAVLVFGTAGCTCIEATGTSSSDKRTQIGFIARTLVLLNGLRRPQKLVLHS